MYMLSRHVVFIWPQGYKTETSFSIFIYTIYSAFLFVKAHEILKYMLW